MRFFKSFVILSLCFACFYSCTTTAGTKRLYTNITDNSKFFLLPPEEIGQTMDMAQYVSAEFGGQSYFFIAWVKADENAIEMAFFNDLGAGIGELSYSGEKAHFSSTVIPRAALRYLKPEYIVADFQLCFYEPLMLGKALEDSGLVLEIQGDNRSGNRRILSGEKVIIEIVKTDNTVKLVNFLRGYTYTMEGEFLGIK